MRGGGTWRRRMCCAASGDDSKVGLSRGEKKEKARETA